MQVVLTGDHRLQHAHQCRCKKTSAHKHVPCRLREKLAEYRASEGSADLSGAVSVPPGSADLTLKVKDIDPRNIPEGLASAEDHAHPAGELFTEQLETGKRPHLNVKVC